MCIAFKLLIMCLGMCSVLFSINACASSAGEKNLDGFEYKQIKMGFGEEGYEQKEMPDGSWEVKVIAMNPYPKEVLVHYFHKRASEICGENKYSLIDLNEMIDVCSEGGCFKSAVRGGFKCKEKKTGSEVRSNSN